MRLDERARAKVLMNELTAVEIAGQFGLGTFGLGGSKALGKNPDSIFDVFAGTGAV